MPEPSGGGLHLPRVWTLSAERVVEAVVLDMEARGVQMPGLKAYDYDLDRLADGGFVLRSSPKQQPDPDEGWEESHA
jgi:hypothetical protein